MSNEHRSCRYWVIRPRRISAQRDLKFSISRYRCHAFVDVKALAMDMQFVNRALDIQLTILTEDQCSMSSDQVLGFVYGLKGCYRCPTPTRGPQIPCRGRDAERARASSRP